MLDGTEKDWRAAKIPKWVVEAVEAEMHQWRLTAALAWPTEAKPEPAPFWWGGYDRLTGTVVPGEYWQGSRDAFSGGRVHRITIRERGEYDTDDAYRRAWRFKVYDGDWTASVPRGSLYASEHDAWLALLWEQCEESAKHLMAIRSRL